MGLGGMSWERKPGRVDLGVDQAQLLNMLARGFVWAQLICVRASKKLPGFLFFVWACRWHLWHGCIDGVKSRGMCLGAERPGQVEVLV